MKHLYATLIILMAYSCSIYAQNIPEMPLRYSHRCSIEHTQSLTNVPPYQWSMPLQVFQSYYAIDSICKMSNIPLRFEEVRELMKTTLQSIEYDSLFKYLYVVLDYNPLIFYQYINTGNYFNMDYKIPLQWIYKSLTTIVNDLNCNQKDAFLALSSGIFRIRITNIVTDSTKYARCATCYEPIKCITADVIDVIKGGALPKITIDDNGEIIKYITFSYSQNWEMSTRMKYSQDVIRHHVIIQLDSAGNIIDGTQSDDTYRSKTELSIGDECIVSLSVYMEEHNDSTGMTPYLVFPQYGYQAEGGIYLVRNGIVYDKGNFFGMGTEIQVDNFISGLKYYVDQKFYIFNR